MNKLLSALLCLTLVGCTLNSGDWREVRVRIQTPATAGHLLTSRLPIARGGFADDPSSIDDMQCVGLNIVGKGIRSYDPDEMAVDFAALVAGEDCTYPGVGTGLKTMGQQDFEMKVSAGNNRIFQVYGIESSSTDCGALPPMGDLMLRARKDTLPSSIQGIYEVGRTVLSEFRTDTTVEIGNSYDSTDSKNFLECDSSGTSGGLTLTNDKFGMTPAETHTLLVTGGSGSYSCAITPVSFGSCSVTAGIATYTAPADISISAPFTSVSLRVEDLNQRGYATAAGMVFAPTHMLPALQPVLWLRGDQSLSGGNWSNSMTGKAVAALSTSTFSQDTTGGPKSTPTYTDLGLDANFISPSSATFPTNFDGMTFYAVAKMTAGNSLFCFSPAATPILNCSTYAAGTFTIRRSSTNFELQVSNTSGGDTVTHANAATSFQIHEAYWDSGAGSGRSVAGLSYMLGGVRVGTSTLTPSLFPMNVGPGFSTLIALGSNNTVPAMKGAYSEVLLFPVALTVATRRNVLNYLKLKYGLDVLLP